MHTLYYVHDPMCSWCWGFVPTLERLESELPDTVAFTRLLGGLAPDSDEPMEKAMQERLQATWQHIATAIPGTEFNHDFWTQNQPRRSTWPSCRAVLCARAQDRSYERKMISAIQKAYYLDAANPSDTDILVKLAIDIGCNRDPFVHALHSESTQQALIEEIAFSQQLGVQGFPSLVLVKADQLAWPVRVNYQNHSTMLEQIHQQLAA